MENKDLTLVTLTDKDTEQKLSPQSLASAIIFEDGETLQQKYDNGTLMEGLGLSGIQAISPKVEVAINTEDTFVLKFTDASGVPVITPNLIGKQGEKGEKGDTARGVFVYEKMFDADEFSEITYDENKTAYVLRINKKEHNLGYTPIVRSVYKYISDTEIVSVTYASKRFINGDISILAHEPYSGIILLEGE